MSARSFRSVGWVAGVAATALGCYMVNLKVAAERVALEEVETRIVIAQRDIRLLQTEIGTRGRLAQLEKWNVKVLALSAPQANQFLEGSFQLATLTAPEKVVDPAAPMVLASAPAPVEKAPVLRSDGPEPASGQSSANLMHVASLKRDLREGPTESRSSGEKPAAKPASTLTAHKGAEPLKAPVVKGASLAEPKKATAKMGSVKTASVKSAATRPAPTKADASAKSKPAPTLAAASPKPKKVEAKLRPKSETKAKTTEAGTAR